MSNKTFKMPDVKTHTSHFVFGCGGNKSGKTAWWGMGVYRPSPHAQLLVGKLFTDKAHINGITVYNMNTGHVGISYPDGPSRLINGNWYDDEQFDEPTDERMEQLALEALAEGLQKSDPLAMQYGRTIPLEFFLIDPFLNPE